VLAELHEHLAEPGDGVLVLGVEGERVVERAARPRELLAREARVPEAHVQLHRLRVEREPLAEHVERLVVLALVVEGVRALVVLFGAQERVVHAGESSTCRPRHAGAL
jgi:hypothetical protein